MVAYILSISILYITIDHSVKQIEITDKRPYISLEECQTKATILNDKDAFQRIELEVRENCVIISAQCIQKEVK